MPRMRALHTLVAAGLFGLSMVSCADQGSSEDFVLGSDAGASEDATERAGDGAAPDEDTTADDTTADDTGVDAEDTGDTAIEGDVVRRIVERDFYGDLPVRNLFVDPTFRGRTSWLPIQVENGQPTDYAEGHREVHSKTPLTAPVFRIPSAGSSTDVRVLGRLALRQSPVDVSIWVGRKGQFDDSIEIELIGVTADDPSSLSTATLSAKSGSEVEVGEIRWKKFETRLTGFFGNGYLTVEGSLGSSLYLHGPVAQKAQAMPNGLRQFATPELRPATELDRSSIRVLREWTRRHRPDPRNLRTGPSIEYFTPNSLLAR